MKKVNNGNSLAFEGCRCEICCLSQLLHIVLQADHVRYWHWNGHWLFLHWEAGIEHCAMYLQRSNYSNSYIFFITAWNADAVNFIIILRVGTKNEVVLFDIVHLDRYWFLFWKRRKRIHNVSETVCAHQNILVGWEVGRLRVVPVWTWRVSCSIGWGRTRSRSPCRGQCQTASEVQPGPESWPFLGTAYWRWTPERKEEGKLQFRRKNFSVDG